MFTAIILGIVASHYVQESACGHHNRFARWSLYAAAIAYALYALKHALAGA